MLTAVARGRDCDDVRAIDSAPRPMPVRNHRKAARANTAKHTTATGTSSERSRPSRLPKNGDRTPESIDEPSVCIVRIGSATGLQTSSLSVAPMISSPPNVGDSGFTRDRNDWMVES